MLYFVSFSSSLISEKEKFVRNLMKTMNSEQREEVLVFWEVFSEFFVQLMDAINEWFDSIVEEINNGKKINRMVLKEIFDELDKTMMKFF
jgi:superfamily II RNA helicase